jgi:hypothetical protein
MSAPKLATLNKEIGRPARRDDASYPVEVKCW